jgi:hypothetical protein
LNIRNVISSFGDPLYSSLMNDSIDRDDSQIALRIATSAAFYTAVFFVAISVLATFLAP